MHVDTPIRIAVFQFRWLEKAGANVLALQAGTDVGVRKLRHGIPSYNFPKLFPV